MKAISTLAVWCAAAALGALVRAGDAPEEFAGPFESWRDVRRDYGARGDGAADDTAAIQKALDDLKKHEKSCVLYFPAGTYRVTETVKTRREAHTDCMGIALVGEDPDSTAIRWEGKPGGTILKYDAWYSKVSRLALDGRGRAAVALAYGDAFSTYNETSDMVFRDVETGMLLATADQGQAENAVLRCRFQRCSKAGIATVNFNSLDIWAWHCVFEDCGHGMYNGAGNFHAWQNLFLRSRKADIGTANLMVFSFVENVSIGSTCFIDFSGGHTWGSPTSITGNRVIDPTGDWAIRLSNGGPYLIVDNVIRSRPGSGRPAVELTWGDQVLVGNVYTVASPVKEAGRFRRLDEKVVDPGTIDARTPRLPATPARKRRTVLEVPAGADAKAIQAAIDRAARDGGSRAVVHIPMGTFRIDRTLVIPAGSDLQLAGDGAAETATVLAWTGEAGGLVLKLEGPSRATVRDLSIQAPGASGILVERCDQAGGQVFADQLNVSGMGEAQKARAGILVSGVETGDVLLRSFQGGSFCGKWIDVVGGARRAAGEPANGQVAVLTGATGTSDLQYDISRGGRLIVRGVYHEMSAPQPRAILLKDSGSLTIDSTRFSYKTTASAPLIEASGFRGDLTLLTGLLLPVDSTRTARIEVKDGGADCNVLAMGNLFTIHELGVSADTVWGVDPGAKAHAALAGCNVNSGVQGATRRNGFDFLEDRGEASEDFLRKMLKPLREVRIWWPEGAPPGATDVRLHRVLVSCGKDGVGMELRAGR